MNPQPAPQLACMAAPGELPDPAATTVFACDHPHIEGGLAALAGVVLPGNDEARAAALLERGAARVFLGEAALLDGGVVERLAARFGAERIGVAVDARRMEVGWSFETASNADFKVVTPSAAEPCWEILRADGRPSGTRVHWWLEEMMQRGASAALVRVDLCDDADLNLCAGLVEALGERLWLGPLEQDAPVLGAWVAYGRLACIVLPPDLFARRAELLQGVTAGDETGAVPAVDVA